MDSVSQLLLGASVVGALSGKHARPQLLIMGMGLGTLPDLDVLIDYGDPIANMVNHRGFSHALLLLFPLALGLAWLLRRFWFKDISYARMSFMVSAGLLTHPLLDSLTSYGTQLFWPLDLPSVAISSLFIIDPLYTLPLLVAVVGAFLWRDRGQILCVVGLIVSSIYILWSFSAKWMIEERVAAQLKNIGTEQYAVFVTPTPLNTVLWRVLVMEKDSEQPLYWEGLASVLDEQQSISWKAMPTMPIDTKEFTPALMKFTEFTQGFQKFEMIDDYLIVTDLRLGMANYHPFQFVIAKKDTEDQWQWIDPQQQEPKFADAFFKLPALWLRLLGDSSFSPTLERVTELTE